MIPIESLTDAQLDCLVPPLLGFLGRALAARAVGSPSDMALWREAAEMVVPLHPEAADALCLTLSRSGRHDQAIELAAKLSDIDLKEPKAFFRLGLALLHGARPAEAMVPLKTCLDLDPSFPVARNNIAAALIQLDEGAEAIIPWLEAEIAVNPAVAEAWTNLGTQCVRTRDLERAITCSERALELAPNSVIALNNHALVMKEAQRWDAARRDFESCIRLSGGEPLYRLNLGLLDLLEGRYAAGWDGFEFRSLATDARKRSRPQLGGEPWKGQALEGRTLLIWGEEGYGDVIQFCRFLPRMTDEVRRRGGRLVWNSFPNFGELLRNSFAGKVDAYVTGGIPELPRFDYEMSLLSVPGHLGVDREALSAFSPYIFADSARGRAWVDRPQGDGRLDVGLVWSGSPDQGRNPFRSVRLDDFADAFSGLRDVVFHSLQVGRSEEVLAARSATFVCEDPTPHFTTFDDTAAFIDQLDLVITVCTSVAHLSAAMGKPTWVLLDVNPHWAWGIDQDRSPWYPTARLFRQRRFGDWAPVFGDLADALGALTESGQGKAVRQTENAHRE